MSETYPITIKNNSTIIDDSKVWVVVKGQDPDNNSGSGVAPDGQTYTFTMIESYLEITAGTGSWVRVDQTDGKSSTDFAVALSDLPDGILNIPLGTGARIYFSFDHKMVFTETVGYKTGQVPDTLSIGEPDPADASDVNYFHL